MCVPCGDSLYYNYKYIFKFGLRAAGTVRNSINQKLKNKNALLPPPHICIISFTVNAGGKNAQDKRVRNSKSSAIIDKQLKREVLMILKRIFK